MDENIDKKRIEEVLKRAGVDLDGGRFEVEASHLSTLFLQGKTIAQALETVAHKAMLRELRSYMYGVTPKVRIFRPLATQILPQNPGIYHLV